MEVILTLVGMFVGAIITWWFAWHYYEKASRDLAAEAKELKRLNILMLRGLESAGMVEFSRDDEGNIKGMVMKGAAKLQANSTMSGTGTVTPKEEK